ncbi:TonB-dependent receptor [Glaciecola sp. MH2013]|uniref:TonB-dependent receptor n=1 Tax=Glaciecola sp. MH2013 TaxID=2785524 RepID=UPI00189C94DB|nr:TonB-dependent receptor [Glaciecola sp. MH2013]MBF7071971.1 TonB-dependent receptor [Glaciecola sp. MH2013]
MFAKMKLNRIALAVAVSVGLSTAAIAQETSSSLRGTVATEAGQIVSGATVTLIDTRTGSARTIQTSANGTFNARGLRVGGPYTLIVAESEGSRTIEDVYVNLGEAAELTISLVPSAAVERIVVTGSASGLITETVGPSSNYGFDDLQFQPSVDRDIKDVIQNDPRITIDATNSSAIQCAGGNNRGNSVTVDGVQQNDNFGLNGNGYPTERLPFPFDAIDQVDVQLAPFDVTYGGFTGCNINAVIRSGANDVFGSVFIDYTNDDMQGNTIEGNSFDVAEFDEIRYGFTVGAPIIKDTLFIFGAFEKHEPTQIFNNGPEGAGFASPIAGLTVADLEEVRQIARDVYGYEVGEILNSADEREEKVLIKLEWLINDDHRATLTYQNTDGNTVSSTGSSTSSYAFNDRYYERANELTTLVGSVYSNWTDNFSTEVRLAKAEVKNGQKPFTSDASFADVTIQDAFGSVDINLGADQFRQANILNYDTLNGKIAGTYVVGDHEITAGYEFQATDVFNLFVPRSQGRIIFNNTDDRNGPEESGLENFRNQLAQQIEYAIPASLDPNDGAAAFTFDNSTFYVQDKWYATDDLTLTFGLRYDTWTSDDKPVQNDRFETRYGFSNAQEPDMDLLQPRLGFNYIVSSDTFVYGGVGLFAGGNPNVWLSNNYSNNGVTILGSDIERTGSSSAEELAALNGANTANFGLEVPQLSVDSLTGGDGAVNALDPDFEIPSLWKYNIGTQHSFENDVLVGIDFIYSVYQDSAKTIPLNVVPNGRAPDNRPIYRDFDVFDADCAAGGDESRCGRSGTDYLLTNSDEDGDAFVASTFVTKRFDNGFKTTLGYAFQNINDGSPMNSSTASSNFGNLSVSDLNEPGIATSNYETEHRFTLQMSYVTQFVDGLDTRFTLFGTRQSGRPFSFTFDNDPGFGDERSFEDRNLLYVPRIDDPLVNYSSPEVQAEIDNFIEEYGLEGKRGQILDRNSQRSAWWTRIDLRVSQEVPGFMEGHKGEVYFAIRNLGNLINDDWGVLRQVPFEYNSAVIDATINDDGTYTYTNFDGVRDQGIFNDPSTYSIRVGVKYTF